MTVATGVVLRCSARWVGAVGDDNVNVWWFETDFATPQLEEDVFDGCDGAITRVFLDIDHHMRNYWATVDLKVDVVEHISGQWKTVQNVGFGSWGAAINTSGSADALPAGVAPLGFLHTGLGKHTGRKFLFGFTEDESDSGGKMTAAAQASMVTGLTQLLTPYVISAGNDLITVVADMAAGIVREVVEVLAAAHFGYQRRRRKGSGS